MHVVYMTYSIKYCYPLQHNQNQDTDHLTPPLPPLSLMNHSKEMGITAGIGRHL